MAERPRFWLRRGASAGRVSVLAAVLALSGFSLLAPAGAAPAVNDDQSPIIGYTVSGITGTNGWYRGSKDGDFVVLRWTVRDDAAFVVFTSGCAQQTINGPNSGTTRTCTAWSDNGMASVTTKPIKIDADPPYLGGIAVSTSRRIVRLRWSASPDAHLLITRSPGRGSARSSVIYRGTSQGFSDRTVKGGVEYRYRLVAVDQAGNSVVQTVRAVPPSPLLTPRLGVRLRSPEAIQFAWEAVPRAAYYNLQLWLGGEKVLTAWPSAARFRLVTPWDYGGARRDLRPGRYTWYVWPGRGARSLGAYRPLLGSSTFLVTR